LTIDDKDIVRYELKTPVNIPIIFTAENIRNEKTGEHAQIGIVFDDSDIYTVCNIKRHDERTKLANKAYQFFGSSTEEAEYICPKAELIKAFDKFCKLVYQKKLQVQSPKLVHGILKNSPVSYVAKPHVLSNGGTIMYGKPGTGKSFTGIALAIAVNSGANHYWETEQQNAMFVNLERPENSMAPRVGAINRALGLNPDHPLPIHDAKDSTLMGIHDSLVNYISDHDIKFVVIDSLSQAGNGDLKEDTVASATIKILNRMGVSWLTIAHTPKYDDSVYYGNSLWEAGADVMLRHDSEKQEDGSIVTLLEVTKANDMPIPKPMGLHYSFDEFGLSSIRFANEDELVDLKAKHLTFKDEIIDWVSKNGAKSPTDIAKDLNKNRSKVVLAMGQLVKEKQLISVQIVGNEKKYGIPQQAQP
jgi:hypothetical protein